METRTMRPAHFANRMLALLGVLYCALFLPGCGFGERDDILILVRAEDPISQAIAHDYAALHNIPGHRILSLQLSGGSARETGDARTLDVSTAAAHNEITPSTFDSEIAAPIESYLAAQDPDNDISIVVTTLGIPLRIGHCESNQPHYPRDCQSMAVDAALAALGRLTPAGGSTRSTRPTTPTTNPVDGGRLDGNANPYFGDPRPFEQFRQDEPAATLRFLVARLSGPGSLGESESMLPTAVRQLIHGGDDPDREAMAPATAVWEILTNASAASHDPASQALIDPIHDLLPQNGPRICNGCATPVESRSPVGVIVLGESSGHGVADLPKRLAFPGFVIALGGLAEGRLSLDRTLEPWLARGARAISLHLDDPSLGGVTRPALLLRAWSEGRMAVEAHFNGVPHLGWTNVFVGDPLLTMMDPATLSSAERNDRDHDGIRDREDNCQNVANPDQRDSNQDGIGNRCDPDVNNDGHVDTSWGKIYPVDRRGDLESIALTARNGPFNPDHDLDGDGVVDDRDLALAQLWLFRSPGPSGIH